MEVRRGELDADQGGGDDGLVVVNTSPSHQAGGDETRAHNGESGTDIGVR
ncbi:MAG: hypothetical protein M3O70_26965 [Actinomycetota bacterium]|nr:hypothetical protein [Actinomycetota bacterium]